jgi:hypothetical protein
MRRLQENATEVSQPVIPFSPIANQIFEPVLQDSVPPVGDEQEMIVQAEAVFEAEVIE